MSRAISSWIIKVGYYAAKHNLNVIPYSGGSYFPLDPSVWPDVDPL